MKSILKVRKFNFFCEKYIPRLQKIPKAQKIPGNIKIKNTKQNFSYQTLAKNTTFVKVGVRNTKVVTLQARALLPFSCYPVLRINRNRH